jgi:hypothetical protein
VPSESLSNNELKDSAGAKFPDIAGLVPQLKVEPLVVKVVSH